MLNSVPVTIVVGTALGFLSGLGVGGGSILILWLTLVQKVPSETARLVNLLFFLPAALISILFRWKQQCISPKKVIPAMLSGCLTALLFSNLAVQWDTGWMKKLFGLLLLVIGVQELRYGRKHP